MDYKDQRDNYNDKSSNIFLYDKTPFQITSFLKRYKCMERKSMSGCLGLRVGRETNCKWAWEFYWGSENVLKLINDDGCITT